MDEVDDILNQDRVTEEDIEHDEEDEDEDEDDEAMLRNDMAKEAAGENHEQDEEDDDDGDDDDDEEDDDDDDDDEEEEDDENDGDQDGGGGANDEDEDDEDEDDDMDDDDGDENESEDSQAEDSRSQDAKVKKDDGAEIKDRKSSPESKQAQNSSGRENDVQYSENEDAHDIDLQEEDHINENVNGNRSKPSGLDKVHNYYTQILRSAKIADTYNIYPTAAIPIQTSVNTLSMSKGLEYLFLGGSDGFIRKYDFLNSVDGKLSLTILQKHSLAESIQNAGILLSYWENEIPQKKSEMKLLKNNREYDPKVSPVYSLEVQSECLFLLSGLENGGITMQGVRYMEGSIAHYFKGKEGHNNVVNLLKLNGEETRFLSGSWDKRVLEWDLETGNIINEFKGSLTELSSLEWRPLYSTVNINDVTPKLKNDGQTNEDEDDDMDSLFGDDEEEEDAGVKISQKGKKSKPKSAAMDEISRNTLNIVYEESVFMTSGLNGSVNIWDRRAPSAPVLSFERGPKVPPWCQSACWCMDGDHIYAGRRNAMVEEFDLKMPSKPSNVLKLPAISGPVTCVRAMPNNKQILCASRDNIRLYNTGINVNSKGTAVPFLIVPGHHGGVISNLYVDPTCRFLISTSGTRGWQGNTTDTTFIYEIDLE